MSSCFTHAHALLHIPLQHTLKHVHISAGSREWDAPSSPPPWVAGTRTVAASLSRASVLDDDPALRSAVFEAGREAAAESAKKSYILTCKTRDVLRSANPMRSLTNAHSTKTGNSTMSNHDRLTECLVMYACVLACVHLCVRVWARVCLCV